VAVIGAGAAGMAAAVAAAMASAFGGGAGAEIVCFEKNAEPGRKLLATGNGRCNLSNAGCGEADLVEAFFGGLGVMLRQEAEGRLYPYSGQASAVRDALWEALRRAGARLACGAPVAGVSRADGGFWVSDANGARHRADRVIVATGGKAGPQYGCAGDGYRIAKGLGHSVASPLPSLVRLTCAEGEAGRLAALEGARAKGEATLWLGGRRAASEAGEIQFTRDGLSGICVFDLSRHLRPREADGPGGARRVTLDLAPGHSEEELAALFGAGLPAGLAGVAPEKVARMVRSEAGGDPRRAARLMKSMAFAISGTKGWKEAQSTSGGVPLDEVGLEGMESRITPGLHFAGEVLDYDGRCGGYNLHWAWVSGMKAGAASVSRGAGAADVMRRAMAGRGGRPRGAWAGQAGAPEPGGGA
jgi:predicted Rossmann fold flavoprotein